MQSAEAATPGADVGHAGELEQALDGPVLAERPVQDRQHDVDRAERLRRARVGEHRQRLRDVALQQSVTWRLRAPSGRRGRSRSSSSRSARGRAPRAPSARRRARSRARSSGRPRPRRRGSGRLTAVVGRLGRRLEAADDDHDRRALLGVGAALGVLREHAAVEGLVVDDLLDHLHLEPRGLELRRRVGLGLARHVRDLRGLRALRHLERDHGALRLLRARGRGLADDDPGRLVGVVHVLAADREAAPCSCDSALSNARADHVRHRDRLRPLGDVDAHGRALDHLGARLRAPSRARCRPARAS